MNSSVNRSDTNQIQNFVQENVMKSRDKVTNSANRGKQIRKDVLEFVLKSQQCKKQLPTVLLQKDNKLLHYLRQMQPQYISNFINIYNKAPVFRLMNFGDYCGRVNYSYVVFSQISIAYIYWHNEKWIGFCYRVNQSVYIGEFDNMKPKGHGKALFKQIKEDIHALNSDSETVYHEFEGIWKQGQIQSGVRRTYRENDQMILQYEGKFKNFQFEDQNGTITKGSKMLKAHFERGICKNIIAQPNNQISSNIRQSNLGKQ